MNTGQIVGCIIFLVLAIGAFVISYLQFQEKGYLFNNAYVWASQEERKKIDEYKGRKRLHYRQSGFAFMLIGFICLIETVYLATDWIWMFVAFWIAVIIAVVYAIISSIQREQKSS